MGFIPAFALLFILSCSQDDDETWQYIGKFPAPIELEGVRVFESEFGIIHITQADSLIIIATQRDTLFHVYDKKENYLGGFGQIGEGPYELPFYTLIQDVITHNSAIVAFIYNQNRQTLFGVDIPASTQVTEPVVKQEYKLPQELKGAYRFHYLDKESIVGIYDDRFSRLLDHKSGGFYYYVEPDTFETFPLINLEVESNGASPGWIMHAGMNLNIRMMAVSPDRTQIALLINRSPKLEIFRVGSHSPDRYLLHPDPPEDIFNIDLVIENAITIYFEDLYATDDYLYMLYSGRLLSDDESHEKYLQVIDWSGLPHKQFKFPASYDLRSVVVDEENKVIYGMSYSNDAIYKFDYSSADKASTIN